MKLLLRRLRHTTTTTVMTMMMMNTRIAQPTDRPTMSGVSRDGFFVEVDWTALLEIFAEV